MTVLGDQHESHKDSDSQASAGERHHFDPGLAHTQALKVAHDTAEPQVTRSEPTRPFQRTTEQAVIRVDSGAGRNAERRP